MPAPVEEPAAIADDIGLENTGTAVADLAGFEYGIEGGVVGGVVGGLETAPPPPPPDPPKPVRIGGNITPPRLVHRVNPEYPPIAQTAQIEGIVILEATVDTSGGVDEVRVLRSHPFLQQAAIRAVEQWRYEPLVLNGQPMPFVLTVTVSFSVD